MTRNVVLRVSATSWILLLLVLPVAVEAQFNYITNEGGTITVTGYTGFDRAVSIPDTIDGMPVIRIEEYAFRNLVRVTSLTIPNTVVSIGANGFSSCSGLTNIVIPNSVTNIGASAFLDCGSMIDLTIGTNVISIEQLAFYGCSKLTRIVIPGSVTSIGSRAFGLCASVTNILVDPQNSFYSTVDGILFNKSQTTIVGFPPGNVGSYALPGGITNIGESAFFACGNLTSVTIPDSVSSIPFGAFEACNSLFSVTIGSGVTSISAVAFTSCPSLTNIAVDALNSSYSSVDGVLFNKSGTTLIVYPGGKSGGYVVPATVTSVGDGAFDGCSSLTSVTIPDSVHSIGNGAFVDCFGLTNATIGTGVTDIENFAFNYCNNLSAIYFSGNAPVLHGVNVFQWDTAMVYYLQGTVGWAATYGGLPTAVWPLPNPLILSSGQSFGMGTNGFGFIVSWVTNASVVVEASTDLDNPAWLPVSTNTFTSGSSYFSDPQWTNYPARFYRLRWQQ